LNEHGWHDLHRYSAGFVLEKVRSICYTKADFMIFERGTFNQDPL